MTKKKKKKKKKKKVFEHNNKGDNSVTNPTHYNRCKSLQTITERKTKK